MIDESQNIALLTVGNAAAKNPQWKKYAQYCFLREKGLRKESFSQLNEFLQNTDNWTEEEKIKFVEFLFLFCETVQDADYGSLPQPLSEKLIKPTLEQWCLKETVNSKPFRWYGKYYRSHEHLNKALEINSHDDEARQVLLEWGTGHLDCSVHHLPEYYIGDFKDDMLFIEEMQNHINKLADSKLQQYWTNELMESGELVINYAEWNESGHPDLIKWGEENNKRVSSGVQTFYYRK